MVDWLVVDGLEAPADEVDDVADAVEVDDPLGCDVTAVGEADFVR